MIIVNIVHILQFVFVIFIFPYLYLHNAISVNEGTKPTTISLKNNNKLKRINIDFIQTSKYSVKIGDLIR